MPHSIEVCNEVIELCKDLRIAVSQQLSYYRASVYKAESAPLVTQKIEQLRIAAIVLLDDGILECFRDFDFLTLNKCGSSVPGECGLTFRVSKLLNDFDVALKDLQKRIVKRAVTIDHDELMNAYQAKRSDLIALCKFGSRSWQFFQSF